MIFLFNGSVRRCPKTFKSSAWPTRALHGRRCHSWREHSFIIDTFLLFSFVTIKHYIFKLSLAFMMFLTIRSVGDCFQNPNLRIPSIMTLSALCLSLRLFPALA